MNKYKIIPVFIIIAVLGIGSIFLSKSSQREEGLASTSIEEKVATISDQYKNGSITREEANAKFCILTARSENEQREAIEAIRIYTNTPNLIVEYKCNNFSPNNPTAEPTEETYLADGKYYFVDVATNKVISVQ